MNTLALDEVTEISLREGRVAPVEPTVRVTIREVREYAFRALIVAGASPGEAATAAGQVLHAELHGGGGLTGLVSDLATGPWPRSGPTCSRRSGTRPVLEVEAVEHAGELRLGACLIDLVAGEPDPAIVATAADVPVTSLSDEPLLAAASRSSTTVAALRPHTRGQCVVRLATKDGDLAQGLMDPAGIASLADLDGLSGYRGLVLLTDDPAVQPALTQSTWSREAQRTQRRRQAALHGIEVRNATWRIIADHAQRFLVPQSDE